jgi:urea transport system substrate-binding protein
MPDRRHARIITALALLAIVAAACSGGESSAGDGADAPAGEPIKIGVVAETSGGFAAHGQSIANATLLAVTELNDAGGIAGREVVTIIEEIATQDVAGASERARKLVEQDRVDVVIGSVGSDTNDAVYRTVVQEGRTLHLYPTLYEGLKCDPLFFSFGAVPAQQLRPLIGLLHDEYGSFAMLFGADYVWPQRSFEIARPIIEEKRGIVVSELLLPFDGDDFSELVAEVRDKQPDYILSLYPGAWDAALRALDDEGLLEGVGIGTPFVVDQDLDELGSLADGHYAALPFLAVSEGPGVAGFLEGYAAASDGAIPNGGTAVGAYDAVHMYKAAVEKAGTTEAAAVAKAMAGLSFEGPTGKVTMMPSHHLQQPITIARSQDGAYSLVESVPEVSPEEACAP